MERKTNNKYVSGKCRFWNILWENLFSEQPLCLLQGESLESTYIRKKGTWRVYFWVPEDQGWKKPWSASLPVFQIGNCMRAHEFLFIGGSVYKITKAVPWTDEPQYFSCMWTISKCLWKFDFTSHEIVKKAARIISSYNFLQKINCMQTLFMVYTFQWGLSTAPQINSMYLEH